jgi:hypothetical protein
MKTTKFYYVHGYSESEYFTSIYIMEMEIEWPLTKQTMLKVLEGSGYAQNIKKVGCIEW